MQVIHAEEVTRRLADRPLIEALRQAFVRGCEMPVRHHHRIGDANMLLLMPAWTLSEQGGYIGIKCVTVFPGNALVSLPSVIGTYLLLDSRTGALKAVLDGVSLTLRRTAAASALAADYLARHDASRLLMVGAGALAPNLIGAHASVRPIREVMIWNRNPDRAETLAAKLQDRPYRVTACRDLASAAREADVISCATLSREPLIDGAWLNPGTHLDLVGGFTPEMREANDAAMQRAVIFVDTRAGACKEAGDIVDPLKRGIIAEADIRADLFDLTRGTVSGRRTADEVTLFKSVGNALEDLAAAELVVSGSGP